MSNANGNGEHSREVFGAPWTRTQQVQAPPHHDQVEDALLADIEHVFKKHTAYAQERVDALWTKIQRLKKVSDYTGKKANVAARAHVQTIVCLRVQTEHLDNVLSELTEGHADLREFLESESH